MANRDLSSSEDSSFDLESRQDADYLLDKHGQPLEIELGLDGHEETWRTPPRRSLLRTFLLGLVPSWSVTRNLAGTEVCSQGLKDSRRGYCSSLGRWISLITLFLVLDFIVAFTLLSLMSKFTPKPQTKPESYLPHWGEPGQLGYGLAHYPTDLTRDIIPIPCHSHNDYERRIPLLDAIHHGFTGVEADVWLRGEELLIGHTASSLTRNRTFRSLYVDPIADILDRQNPHTEFTENTKHGIFDADPDQTLVLLVDLKTEGYATLPHVIQQLEALRARKYLAYFDGEKVVSGPVTVVLTGETPFDALIVNGTYRDVFFDAPLDAIWKDYQSAESLKAIGQHNVDSSETKTSALTSGGQGHVGLGGVTSAAAFTTLNSYYASVSFSKVFSWPQLRPMTASQIVILRQQIAAAHSQGLKVRYWGTPGWPVGLRNSIWKTLTQEGADILNADDLDAAAYGDWDKSAWFSS